MRIHGRRLGAVTTATLLTGGAALGAVVGPTAASATLEQTLVVSSIAVDDDYDGSGNDRTGIQFGAAVSNVQDAAVRPQIVFGALPRGWQLAGAPSPGFVTPTCRVDAGVTVCTLPAAIPARGHVTVAFSAAPTPLGAAPRGRVERVVDLRASVRPSGTTAPFDPTHAATFRLAQGRRSDARVSWSGRRLTVTNLDPVASTEFVEVRGRDALRVVAVQGPGEHTRLNGGAWYVTVPSLGAGRSATLTFSTKGSGRMEAIVHAGGPQSEMVRSRWNSGIDIRVERITVTSRRLTATSAGGSASGSSGGGRSEQSRTAGPRSGGAAAVPTETGDGRGWMLVLAAAALVLGSAALVAGRRRV